MLPDAANPEEPTAFAQILALVRRSDTVAVKSEGTRVFVNAIKTLWATDASSKDPEWAKRRKEAMQKLATPQCAATLAQLIGRSKKYAILINEGVVSLSLLSTHPNGGKPPLSRASCGVSALTPCLLKVLSCSTRL